MKKTQIRICLGTKCYLFGAGDLVETFQNLPEEIQSRYELVTVSCFTKCESPEAKTPIIQIGEAFYYGVQPEKLLEILKKHDN